MRKPRRQAQFPLASRGGSKKPAAGCGCHGRLAGKIGTYERDGSTSTDTTAQTIEQLKMKFSTLEALLAEAQSTNEAPRRGDSDVSK